MPYEDVPGFESERIAFGETTVVVKREQLLDAALHLRDAYDFRFLSDISAADYLGWGEAPTAGYWGSASGRDLNAAASASLNRRPDPKPSRFSVSPTTYCASSVVRLVSGCRCGARTASRCHR